MSLNTDKLNKLQRLAPVRSSELLGDGQRIWNEHGELTCDVCGKHELGLGWPTPHLCMECGRKRDMKEPKACPFCGIVAAMGVQENDGSKFWMTCMVCDAQGPKAELQDLAMWEWNKRKSPNDQAQRPLADSDAGGKETMEQPENNEAAERASGSLERVVRPLPWKITNDDMELKITDANGCSVIYGNVNRGIEFDDPRVPGLLEQAIVMLNRSNDQAQQPPVNDHGKH